MCLFSTLCNFALELRWCSSFAANSRDMLISIALCNVSAFSVSNHFCMAVHTSLSLMASFSTLLNSQCSASFFNMATKIVTDSPSSWFLLWKWNCSVMVNSFGEKCPASTATISSYSVTTFIRLYKGLQQIESLCSHPAEKSGDQLLLVYPICLNKVLKTLSIHSPLFSLFIKSTNALE